jgi:hypothetical protein
MSLPRRLDCYALTLFVQTFANDCVEGQLPDELDLKRDASVLNPKSVSF